MAKTKQAQRKVPAKSGWLVAGKVFLMCLWVAVAVIAVQFVVGFTMIKLLGSSNFGRPVWTAVYSGISYILAMLLVVWVPSKVKVGRYIKNKDAHKNSGEKSCEAVSRRELGLVGLPTWTDVGLGPVGFIASTLLAAGLVSLFTVFPWFNAEEVQNVGFSVYMSGGDRAIAFLTLVVMAPIAEEVIFRGWLYGEVREILNGKMSEKWGVVVAILIVSVLFGAVHMQWNVGVNVFALSVVLCVLREVTGTIYAGILTHMIKNGVAFFLLYVLGMG